MFEAVTKTRERFENGEKVSMSQACKDSMDVIIMHIKDRSVEGNEAIIDYCLDFIECIGDFFFCRFKIYKEDIMSFVKLSLVDLLTFLVELLENATFISWRFKIAVISVT